MQNQILSLDTISKRPSATFGSQTISLIQSEYYDSGIFINKIAQICPKPSQIKKLVYCAGPGAFSPTRAATIIARLLKRLYPDLQVYKINLLSAYYLSLKLPEETNIIYLKAGLKGFFKEAYNKGSTVEQAHLVPEITDKGFLIEEEKYNFNLSENLQNLLIEGKLERYLVCGLENLEPLYLREVSLTKKKTN